MGSLARWARERKSVAGLFAKFGGVLGVNDVPIGQRHALRADGIVSDWFATFVPKGLFTTARAVNAHAGMQPVRADKSVLAVPNRNPFGFEAADGETPFAFAIVLAALLASVAADFLADEIMDGLFIRPGDDTLPVELAGRADGPRRHNFNRRGDTGQSGDASGGCNSSGTDQQFAA